MTIKVIRTESQYHDYLSEIEKLVGKDGRLAPNEVDRLEMLTVLIESYENGKYPVEPPDPIDAIRFRMEERGLRQADLIPYFGTSSRVSEVLTRKRPLTVQMIRAVSLGLGISAETLIGLSDVPSREKTELDWSRFPVKEMMSRGWFERVTRGQAGSPESLVKNYIADAGLQLGTASFRRVLSGEAQSPTTLYALYAWLARVIQRSRKKTNTIGKFEKGSLTAAFLRELAQMSWSERGPLLAVEYLQRSGISFIVEPHLKGTQLDGAALKDANGTPIIALTLRYDRIDNFWFTLLHEVVHIWKHIDNETDTFVDDLNVTSQSRTEAEANRLAGEAFIPRLLWKRSEAFISPSKESIERLARDLKIHPAIIAGRIRKDSGNFSMFSDMLGHNEVRSLLSLSTS